MIDMENLIKFIEDNWTKESFTKDEVLELVRKFDLKNQDSTQPDNEVVDPGKSIDPPIMTSEGKDETNDES